MSRAAESRPASPVRARPSLEECLALEPGPLPDPTPAGPCVYRFPDPALAREDGLVGLGANLEPGTLIDAYRRGIFPWPHGPGPIPWFSPDPRAIIPLDGVHISRRLERRARQRPFRLTMDTAFDQVIAACAQRAEGTWITPAMVRAYCRLHQLGWARSVEAWSPGGALAGGVYGLRVAGLFAAESMFHREDDASKIALLGLLQHCRQTGVSLFDVQILTPHLASLGAVEIPREEYLRRLRVAVG